MENPVNNIILGDFNINLLEMQNRLKISEYFDKFVTSGYLPRITMPTRFSTKGCTLIDQIFCNFENVSQKCSSAILTSKLSDHLPCLVTFEIPPKIYKKPKFATKVDTSEINTKNFIEGITTEIKNCSIETDQSCDPNITNNKIIEIIKKLP